jgi:hypothetical protein
LGIVKSTRRAGWLIGRVVDAEDRRLLAISLIYVGGGATLIIIGACAIGLAVRMFGIAAG